MEITVQSAGEGGDAGYLADTSSYSEAGVAAGVGVGVLFSVADEYRVEVRSQS